PRSALGWAAILGSVLIATVLGTLTFFAGLARVGPTTASTLSTIEPAVTVALAALILSETIAPLQLLGGALILVAVVALARSRKCPRGESDRGEIVGRSWGGVGRSGFAAWTALPGHGSVHSGSSSTSMESCGAVAASAASHSTSQRERSPSRQKRRSRRAEPTRSCRRV